MAAKFYHDQLLLLQALSLLEYCNDIDPDIFDENILKMLIKIFWIFHDIVSLSLRNECACRMGRTINFGLDDGHCLLF